MQRRQGLPQRLLGPQLAATLEQPRMFISVDLPEPEGPMMAMNSPATMRSDTSFNTATSPAAER